MKPSYKRDENKHKAISFVILKVVINKMWKKVNVTLLLLLLSRFSFVRLCATTKMAAHQAPPSLGFSRQEHCSGLPFPSPVHESGKWKVKVKSLSHVQLLATPWTAAHQALPSMGFSRQEYWGAIAFSESRSVQFSSVQLLSRVWLCDPINRSTPGLPVHHQLLEFTQTHFHRIGDAIQPSHPLSSPSLLAPNPSQHQSLFQWVNSLHKVAKVLEFQL